MTRGTTPTLTLKLKNCDVSLLDNVYITFKQNRYQNKVLEKTLDDISVDIEKNTLTIRLTQEDTLYFCESDVEMQLRAVTTNNQAVASKIIKLPVNRILKDGVIK